MIIASCSHMIIKNLFGKKTSGIEDILKSLWLINCCLYLFDVSFRYPENVGKYKIIF